MLQRRALRLGQPVAQAFFPGWRQIARFCARRHTPQFFQRHRPHSPRLGVVMARINAGSSSSFTSRRSQDRMSFDFGLVKNDCPPEIK